MAYTINKYSGATLVVVQDGTIDTTTDLTFVGKNYAGYGEIQNENFLFLLENFSGSSQPPKPIAGQIWHDSTTGKIKFYDGSVFKPTGGAEVSSTQPATAVSGDFWFDSGNNQLYAYDGSSWILVGPQGTGSGLTQMRSQTIRDTQNTNHSVITATIDDEVIFIISPQEFTIDGTDPANAITGFDTVKKGITLINTIASTGGVTSTNHYFWGTASNALKLNGVDAADFVTQQAGQSTSFNELVNIENNNGLKIGDSLGLHIYVTGNTGVIANEQGTSNAIKIQLNNGSSQQTNSATFTSTGMNPGATQTYTLGTTALRWSDVYADFFRGTADTATAIKFDGNTYLGQTSANASTVALRDSSGDITANFFRGTAISAQYADIAEKYTTDQEYPVGTVMAVGGKEEARAAKTSDFAIGVISENPAMIMNEDSEGQAIALKGRVPVRVTGPVSKGQAVYAWADGVASTIASNGLVGVALESSTEQEEKIIECVLKV